MMLIKTQTGCQCTHMLYGLCCVLQMKTSQAFEIEKSQIPIILFSFILLVVELKKKQRTRANFPH